MRLRNSFILITQRDSMVLFRFFVGLTERRYWEMESSDDAVLGVTYKGIKRKGSASHDFGIGSNDKSWCIQHKMYFHHNGTVIKFPPFRDPSKQRIGVYLDWPASTLSFYTVSSDWPASTLSFYTVSSDWPASTLSFYTVSSDWPASTLSFYTVSSDWPASTLSFYTVSSDTLTHMYTFHTTFTEPLYPAFGLAGCNPLLSVFVPGRVAFSVLEEHLGLHDNSHTHTLRF
ncbi:uncharacterized protein LOC115186293 [Salmo trutta]|uniref:uncharacterized protein LOC115186293 n=1 Tax=Salmo trutta TaxID=8032 RepID=UPI00113210D4|nr:uncharacterized protein LOC115186293 [Salmo trutta]XP_029601825.1 uncharacterized protein LOC115186293 [Salmo trutta]